MKKKLQLIVLLFGLLVVQSATVYAQSDSRTICDKIHYSDEMDKACQECWETSINRENKYLELQKQNLFQDSSIISCINEKQAISDTLTKVKQDNTKLQKKVKRNRRIAIGGISGFVAVIILMFAIK